MAVKKRIEYFDIFRGIGIIYMVLGHVYIGVFFDTYIHAFHMPLFFFVSGYFFKNEKYNNMLSFVIHEAKSLLVPYTFFVILCQPLHYIYTGDFNFWYFLLSYFTSNHNRIDVAGAYWFLLCMFSAQIMFYIINSFIKNEMLKLFVVVAVSIFGNCSGCSLPLCMDSAMSMIFVMYLGKKMREYSEKRIVVQIQNLKWWVLTVLMLINAVLIFVNGSVNIRTNHLANVPLFWINVILAIICYLNISIRLEKCKLRSIVKIKNILRYIGKNSIVYLVSNEIVIYTISFAVVALLGSIMESTMLAYQVFLKCAVFVLSILVITIASYVLNNTKLKVVFGRF